MVTDRIKEAMAVSLPELIRFIREIRGKKRPAPALAKCPARASFPA